MACEESSLVKEVPRPQSKPVANKKPNHPPKSLPTSQTPSTMIHTPNIQFLGTTPHIGQIGCLQIWERHLGCTVLWIQHSIWRTLRVTPRFGGHLSEQLKWMNRPWWTPNGGQPGIALRHHGQAVVFKVNSKKDSQGRTLQITGIGLVRELLLAQTALCITSKNNTSNYCGCLSLISYCVLGVSSHTQV